MNAAALFQCLCTLFEYLIFPAKYSPARNGFHDRAPFPIVFTIFTVYTRTKTFQNTLKCVSISFRLGIGSGVNDSSKHNDFVPFRLYFVVV